MPVHARLAIAASAAFAAVLATSPARAQLTMVESGFISAHLSNDFAKQIELGVGPGGGGDTCLYYGSAEGLRRRCGPFDASTICDPAMTFPAGIAFSTGGSFGTKMYVADYGRDDIFRSTGCAVGTMFADMIAPGSIAFPPAGSAHGDYLYACEAFDGPIYRVSSTGVLTSWLALETVYLRFGPGGAWGTGLYATDMSNFQDAKIDRISSTAAITTLVGGFLTPEGFDWGFDGDMFATDASYGEIYRIKSNGTKTLFATLGGAADVAYRPGEQSLYVVSNQGGLYRIVSAQTAGVGDEIDDSPSLSVAPNPARAECALHFTMRSGAVVRAQVWDAAGRLVRRLSESWRPAGGQSIHWDGRDDAGSPVRTGTYFARVELPDDVLRAHVTIVR